MNNKGFTLMELLAVIIIITALSVLIVPNVMNYLKQGEEEYNKNLEEMLVLAGKSYYADNQDKLLDELPTVSAGELGTNSYLSKPINDKKGNSCMKSSYVFVTKDDNNNLEYKACIICDNNEDTSIFENVITKENCLK